MDIVLEDSRRLTGPGLVSSTPGAILDVRLAPADQPALLEAWQARAREMLDRVGWSAESTSSRAHASGLSLVLSAPVDALYAATEVNEWALEAATADVEGRSGSIDAEAAVERLLERIGAESNPALIRLQRAAAQRGVTFLSDDDTVSVGTGKGSRAWPAREPPDPDSVPWDEVLDVPLVVVTGTNGKTTTVRLLAEMVRLAGLTPGFSSTDGIVVGDELVEGGDYSGPGGARTVLRDPRVGAAVLEAARGGMLRRGLGVPRADGSAVTNVGVDHLGEYGIHDIEDVADAKLVVARAVEEGGRLVLNAGDPVLAARAAPGAAELVWAARDPAAGPLPGHLAAGGEAVVVEEGAFVRRRGNARAALLAVEEAPITLGGAAGYNVENALVALALAPALGIPDAVAAAALAGFRPTPDRLPGRTNLFRYGSASVLLDFVHNPHGMEALSATVRRLPADRRLVVVGQAGDRDDESIRALARSAAAMRPARVIVKELGAYRRGRAPGEVPRLIREALRAADEEVEIVDAAGELEAVRSALEWCAEGDLLVLPVQAQRDAVLSLLAKLDETGWRPGRPLPPDVPGAGPGDAPSPTSNLETPHA